jgi:tRNA nucleotidyltransferase (CCA-adding enzyme)
MAVSITGGDFGKLKDVFKGVEDLRSKKIRVLHRLSFIDDPTRILRAVRFEKRYGFRIERATFLLLKEAVAEGILERVEPQRLRDEIILLLKEPLPARHIKRLQQLRALSFIDRRLRVSSKTCRLFDAIDRELKWFMKEHRHRRHLDIWLIYFMALLAPLEESIVRAVCRRFAFRKGEEKRILSYKRLSDTLIKGLRKDSGQPSRVYRALEHLSYEVILLLKAGLLHRNAQRNIAEFLAINDGLRVAISGHDLRSLGITPGPCYQKILYKILDAKIDGKLKTKEEELACAAKLAKQLSCRR